MAKTKPGDSRNLPVTFVDLKSDEEAPCFAVYQLDEAGNAVEKLGRYDGSVLRVDFGNVETVSFGPDVEDLSSLPRERLTSYRVAEKKETWLKQGIVLPRIIWDHFHFFYTCVTGTVSKCHPWYWDIIAQNQFTPMVELAQAARIKPITAELEQHVLFPFNCHRLCDGNVEIYERECCCHHIHIPDLLIRLRDILDYLPIPLPDPIPDPGPIIDPRPGPDPVPFFSARSLKGKARAIQRNKNQLDLSAIPPQNLHEDFLALRNMPLNEAREYVLARPHLIAIHCHCSVRKVGETPIQPGGKFDFCYFGGHFHHRLHHHHFHHHCVRTYAYVVKQLINGVMTVVYDGLAANQFFAAGAPADIRSFNPLARLCPDGPNDPPPNDGEAFVMLEHVGSYGTFHHNFPAQTGESELAPLQLDDGTYTTSYAPDCPWGGALGLRLWFSPKLKSTVEYYRLKVSAVNDAGLPVGTPTVLNSTVTWDKLVSVPGDIIRVPETLGPIPVGAENDLFKVPYWSSPDHRYLSGQYHQVWNTASSLFSDGRYMLIIEVFDGAGNQIKPNGAVGSGNNANFQFRRWVSSANTDPVNFSDCAHAFWVDNTPVGGDVVDLRQNGTPDDGECQFMSGSNSDTFAIGFRAYHVNGVEHAGNGDDNSFMRRYNITWQRGLNGDTGSLGHAPGLTNHTDVGETGLPVSSDTETFATMLGDHAKCPFSVTLHVQAKHFTGRSRIQAYDYWETASFALEIV